MVPMRFFNLASAADAFLSAGPNSGMIIDDDSDFHRNIDTCRGMHMYSDDASGFVSFNPFKYINDKDNMYRRWGNNPEHVIVTGGYIGDIEAETEDDQEDTIENDDSENSMKCIEEPRSIIFYK
jgi:hypothetical protein